DRVDGSSFYVHRRPSPKNIQQGEPTKKATRGSRPRVAFVLADVTGVASADVARCLVTSIIPLHVSVFQPSRVNWKHSAGHESSAKHECENLRNYRPEALESLPLSR